MIQLADDFEKNVDYGLNPLSVARNELAKKGLPIVDFTSGNLNHAGLIFPQERLKEIWLAAAEKAKIYQPHYLGQRVAREAITEYYDRDHLPVSPDHIVITPGSSLSYLYCFKLLANPGEEILCPSPFYPLFETIAKMASLNIVYYRLSEDSGWQIDLDYLENMISTKSRALVLITPHNPTGMVINEEQIKAVADIARRHQLAIISDEVFCEFLFDDTNYPRPAASDAPLVFTLNGFSKMFGLAGIKIGWIAVTGDNELVSKAMNGLELISDTYLPVNEVAQFVVPKIFKYGWEFCQTIKDRLVNSRTVVMAELSEAPFIQYHKPAGGFYITFRMLKDIHDEDELVVNLLNSTQIFIHPGYFYHLSADHLVMTFIGESDLLRENCKKMIDFLAKY